MTSVTPIVYEGVWLDKPKYDAAERRYYQNLAQRSETTKTKISVKDLQEPTGISVKTEVEKKQEVETLYDILSPEAENKRTNGCQKTTNKDGKECLLKQFSHNSKAKENVIPINEVSQLPSFQDSSSEACPLHLQAINKKETEIAMSQPKENVCAKSDNMKKLDLHNKENNTSSAVSAPDKKLDIFEMTNQNGKAQIKLIVSDDKHIKQELNNEKGNFGTDPVSEVVKLKGFYLQSKNLSHQSESSQTKGTNVNTIPEMSKLSQCYDKTKNVQNNVKKIPLMQTPVPNKHRSDDLIISPDCPNEPQAEDQAKRDSKKKKKHKKERQKDKKGVSQNSNSWNSLAGEVAKARQHIKNSLQCIDDIAVTSNTVSVEITNRLNALEKENSDLKNQVSGLVELLKKMELRVSSVEKSCASVSKPVTKAPAPIPAPRRDDTEEDDGVDLFNSDSEEEDTEAARIKEQRLAEYAARKAKKPVLIAKSNIILDVKPWDDETNMKELEAEVRKISTDGLVWGASKLVPLAYGIHKLQISCVVEDDKVSVDWLQETIQEIEEYVQSVDIAAFNKV